MWQEGRGNSTEGARRILGGKSMFPPVTKREPEAGSLGSRWSVGGDGGNIVGRA